jgi:hypothetical protein
MAKSRHTSLPSPAIYAKPPTFAAATDGAIDPDCRH